VVVSDSASRTRREETRESHFWDVFAAAAPVAPVQPAPLDEYAAARLRLLGPLAGKRVLDLGCGLGYGAALLALHGARVSAVDISARCVQTTRLRAAASGVAERVAAQVMSAYRLAFADESFDLVHGQDILHHLDIALAGREIKRVLRRGGRAVFQENNANNPLLMLARRLCGHCGIPRWSTDDEYPLTRAEIAQLGTIFDGAVAVHYPALEFFRLLDMKLCGYRVRPVSVTCALLDRWAYRVPALRPYGYKQIVVLWRLR